MDEKIIEDLNARVTQAIDSTHARVNQAIGSTGLEIRRELWMWRGLMIFLVLLLLITVITTDLSDRTRHSLEGEEHAKAWTLIMSNQGQLKNMIDNNYDLLLTVDELLQQRILDEDTGDKARAIALARRNKKVDEAQQSRDMQQSERDRKGKK